MHENTIFELLFPIWFQICHQIFAKRSGSWDIQFVNFGGFLFILLGILRMKRKKKKED